MSISYSHRYLLKYSPSCREVRILGHFIVKRCLCKLRARIENAAYRFICHAMLIIMNVIARIMSVNRFCHLSQLLRHYGRQQL